ncbi:LipA and NB-ARC domain protein [Aspergillus stella-maris]|uniref:LipA and NB-ARC domain protein n=1 Tax=Aspergillus stella-maris TaxID=1810926 RepID=UPI003CCD8642
MDLASRIRQFGLNVVYDSPNALVDIVFVHGLNGHPHRTWTSSKTGTFWPVDLLPDVLSQSRVRILTYGYNANVTSFTDGTSKDRILNHSETLAASLAANRTIKNCSERPIIFVCHSLGGLVVKRALIYSRSLSNEKVEHLRSIYVSTYGILFLGTPHNGSEVAKWGLLLQNICAAVLPRKIMDSSPDLVKALRTNNETLQNINSLFTDMMPRFHVYFFHETLSTDVKGTREVIVDESSAAPYADGVERMGIEADHSHMCKFDDETAPGFEAVAVALLRYSRDAPSTIQNRWNEEERTRMINRTQKAREIFGDIPVPPQASSDRQTDRSVGGNRPNEAPMVNAPVQSYLPSPKTLPSSKPSPPPSMDGSTDLALSRSIQKEPLWVVPPGFHRNATFVGMERELEITHTRLFKAKKRADNLMSVLISGVPGSGKSHLARQYVWNHREDYPGGIFWIDAKSRQSTFKCFWDIAQAATLTDRQEFQSPDTKSSSKYVEAVRHWLESRQEWLLVFDGISFGHDEDINDFKQFLPFKERCGIIYTSVDKTLRKKQRLYEPYHLLVAPLQVEDACKLLFKDLGIKKPTKEQVKKATEVVTHYECLPLAIHAISHRLSATDKPIEKYHINSHLTDEKLAEPFLSIMHDLYRGEHFEALNLINLLSFLGHHVPVGLITLGKSFLEAWNIEVFASSRHGEHGDLDTTLGVLIRYGLIERTSDKYPLLQTSSSPLSERYQLDMKAVITDLSESQTESSQEGFFTTNHSSGVSDVVKIHSVVQGFCRDELKIMDKESKSKGTTGYYDSWLVVATHVFCTSFEAAKCRMDRVDDAGSVKDYREYETHASQLMKNFPKRTAHGIVTDALKQLKEALKTIRSEIDRISPSSSQESIRKHRSVFDRSSSSSSFPDSTASDGPSRQLTLDFSDVMPVRSESPQEARVSHQKVNLGPIIPHIFRESSQSSHKEEFLKEEGLLRDGYITDDESTRARSPAMSSASQATERPKPPQPSSPPQQADEEGWHVVENPSKSKPTPRTKQPKQQRPKRKRKFPRSIEKPKPAAPVLERTPAQWNRLSGAGALSELSPHRTASEALLAVNKLSPTQSSAYSATRSEPIQPKKENAPTYAYVASRLAKEPISSAKTRTSSSPGGRQRPVLSMLQSRPSEESLSSNMGYSTVSGDYKPDPMSHSTYSEPDHGLLQQLNALDLCSQYPGQPFGNRRMIVPADLSASTPTLSIPYDRNIEIQVPKHRYKGVATPAFSSKSSTNLSTSMHPSAIMPGASPPNSEPAPIMSRGPSGQSHHSWSTEPPSRFLPRISPLPSNMNPAAGFGAAPYQYMPQQQALSGTGSWVSDTNPGATQRYPPVDTSYAAVAQRQYIPPVGLDPWVDKQGQIPGAPAPPPILHFGAHRIDLASARLRSSRQYQPQFQPPPQYVYSHENRSGPLFPLPTHDPSIPDSVTYSQEFLIGPTGAGAGAGNVNAKGGRPRSGSSPQRWPPGLGLNF